MCTSLPSCQGATGAGGSLETLRVAGSTWQPRPVPPHTQGAGQPQPWAPPWGWGQAEARLGHCPNQPRSMARQGRVWWPRGAEMGSWAMDRVGEACGKLVWAVNVAVALRP